ncbi:hypothetical protein FB451DRAFT_984563, partial [Mycena latifolia]
ENPSMCGADFVGANAYAFYDPPSTSSTANNFLLNIVLPAIRNTCLGKLVFITETGWPSRGGKVGAGVASVQDELIMLQGLNCAAQNTTRYAFEYNDQLWKSNDNERSFWIWGKI